MLTETIKCVFKSPESTNIRTIFCFIKSCGVMLVSERGSLREPSERQTKGGHISTATTSPVGINIFGARGTQVRTFH